MILHIAFAHLLGAKLVQNRKHRFLESLNKQLGFIAFRRRGEARGRTRSGQKAILTRDREKGGSLFDQIWPFAAFRGRFGARRHRRSAHWDSVDGYFPLLVLNTPGPGGTGGFTSLREAAHPVELDSESLWFRM